MNKTRDEIEKIAKQVVDAMITVHRELGPGLLESTYQACSAHELRSRGVEARCEVLLPVRYRDLEIEAGYRIDIACGGLHRHRKQIGSGAGVNP